MERTFKNRLQASSLTNPGVKSRAYYKDLSPVRYRPTSRNGKTSVSVTEIWDQKACNACTNTNAASSQLSFSRDRS
jgi:hypothetical protein